MKNKFLIVAIMSFMALSAFAQANLNNYKYVIVPNKFDFLKENDQYQLNSLAHFLFKKHGFEAVLEGTGYPEELTLNRCLALNSDVIKGSGMFRTKLNIVLKDCNDKVIFTSKVGESREKEFKTAYNLALRNAFKSIEALNHNYVPGENTTSLVSKPQANAGNTDEIKQLKKEIQNLKKQKQAEVAVANKPKTIGAPKGAKQKPKVKVAEEIKETPVIRGVSNVLYAQATANGFQLVDSSPKVVYKIKNTHLKDVFLVEGKSAIIYKNDSDWLLEFYSGNVLKQEVLNIKF